MQNLAVWYFAIFSFLGERQPPTSSSSFPEIHLFSGFVIELELVGGGEEPAWCLSFSFLSTDYKTP